MRIEVVQGPVPWAALLCLPLMAAVVGLSGCDRKVELQHAPDARTASDITAALSEHGIVVERRQDKSGLMLSVSESEFQKAMQALRAAGLLRAARPGIDEALGKRGIAPTPLEERARRGYAIERQLETTLMEIDGVVAARVSVVPPERPAPGAPLAPASASVFIKHRADVDLSPLVPGIAKLVKNGVPGLAVEDDRHVAVMLLPEPRPAAPRGAAAATGVSHGGVGTALGMMFLVCGSAAMGYFADRLLRLPRHRSAKRTASEGGDHATAG